jgi:23S rRNA pseudouridine1911/1915/1917 synthase
MSRRFLPVPDALVGERLDVLVSRMLGVSRSTAAGWVDDGRVLIDDQPAIRSARPGAQSVLEVDIPDPAPVRAPELVANLRVIHSDDDIIVVDKPVGVAAHASPGWTGPTVTGGLAAAGYVLSGAGAAERQGIVHRLDVGTSGLMVVAASDRAYADLKEQFRQRRPEKIYHALVQGHPDPTSGTIDAPIGRHPGADYRFAVVADGRPSITHYDVLEAFPHASLVEVHLETGRTHQIRVHFAALKHPCCGDLSYGADPVLAARLGLSRQWLHAHRLAFDHPGTGEWVRFGSPYPADLEDALTRIRGT